MSCNCGNAGVLKICGASVPFINASFSEHKELFTSQSLGSGEEPKDRSHRNFSIAKTYVDGSFTMELFRTGSYNTAFLNLLKRIIGKEACNAFGAGCQISFSSNGGNGLIVPTSDGVGVITQMSLTGSAGKILTASFSILATDFEGGDPGGSSTTFESPGNSDDGNSIPWYSSSVSITGSGDDHNINNALTEWSLSVSVPVTQVYTFNGKTSAKSLRLGMMTVKGSLTYFASNGNYVFNLADSSAIIDIGVATLSLPYIVFDDLGLQNQGVNAIPVRTVGFQAFASGDNASISYS